jgi:hypothetical protein
LKNLNQRLTRPLTFWNKQKKGMRGANRKWKHYNKRSRSLTAILRRGKIFHLAKHKLLAVYRKRKKNCKRKEIACMRRFQKARISLNS